MKVLLLAHAFAPYNASGSVRAVKLAEHLAAAGHDVRVITGAPHAYPATLATTLPAERIVATRWSRIEAPLDLLRERLGKRISREAPAQAAAGEASRTQPRLSLAARAVMAYRSVLSMPDPQAGWIFQATRAARKLLATWRPDLIYSTALPFSSHLVAARLAKLAQCPWVAEFRDLYSGNPYSEVWSARQRLDVRIEKRVLATASAVVAVSPLMTEYLAALHGKPALTVMNGFDPADFAKAPDMSAELDRAKITILYTGIIYPGRRDPAVLFEALRRLGPERHAFEVRFYGPALEAVAEAARRAGVGDAVRTFAPVPYMTSLGLQKAADVLLLLLWDSPLEKSVLTGKLFEYIGAGRPILSLGCIDGAAARIVRERHLGLAADAAEPVVAHLRALKAMKARDGGPPPVVGEGAGHGLSRREQFEALETFLAGLGLLSPPNGPASRGAGA